MSGELKATRVNRSDTVPLPSLRMPPPSVALLNTTRSPVSTVVPSLSIPPPMPRARLRAMSVPLTRDVPTVSVLSPAPLSAEVFPERTEWSTLSWPALLTAPPPPLPKLPVSREKLTVACPVVPRSSPPPLPAVLPVSLTFCSARVPSSEMPPPRAMPSLPENSEELIVTCPLGAIYSPPPKPAVPPVTVTFRSARVPRSRMPPPKLFVFPLARVTPDSVRLPPAAT